MEMEKERAIELLIQAVDEIPHLKTLRYQNDEMKLWLDKVGNILRAGLKPEDYSKYWPVSQALEILKGVYEDNIYQEEYLRKITNYEIALKSIIQKYEILGIERERSYIEVPPESIFREVPPKAFIAHGGDSPALSKLKNFLEALGVEPIVVEEQPSEGRSVAENVDWYSRQADCAIILATKGDVDSKTGGFIPRGNVLIEIGKSQEIFKDRIIYLLQAGAHLPTNVSEKVWGRFTTQCMDDAFIKVAIELYKFGLLKSVKHPKE